MTEKRNLQTAVKFAHYPTGKQRRLWSVFSLILVSMAILSACATTQTPISSTANATTIIGGQATFSPTARPIAAKVNDETILLSDLNLAVDSKLAGIRSVGDPEPADMNTFRLTVLDTLIEQRLIEQAAKIQNIVVTDQEVETELQATINIAGGRDKWLQQLQADNMTESEYRIAIRSAMITQRMRDIVTASSCVNIEQIHARHILVKDLPTAQAIKVELDKGTDFAQLALQYSLDLTTRQSGGDLGFFALGQLLQPTVEQAALSLPIGQISEPVQSDLGYHLIQVLERVKDRAIDENTCYRLSEAAFERWVQELVNKATIEKFPNGN